MPGGPTVYDPIDTLMEEHRAFLERLHSYRTTLRSLVAPDAPDAGLPGCVYDFARFLDRDVTRFHGRKEEEGLFPVLGRHIPVDGGPIGVMLEEHESLKEQHGVLLRNAGRIESDPEAHEAVEAIVRHSQAVETILTAHIDKEDHVLFPMARDVLSAAELAEVAESCRRIEADSGH